MSARRAVATRGSVDVDVGTVPYEVRGDGAGPPVVLLHGFPGASATWTATMEHLAAAGRRTVAPTQRGYASTARPRQVSAYRASALAADVLAVADATAGGGGFHLVGHDWGALVGWYLAATRPDRVLSFTALSTPHPRAAGRSVLVSSQALRSWYVLGFQVPIVPEAMLTAGGGRVLQRLLTAAGLPADHAAQYGRLLAEPGAAAAAINWYRAAFRHPQDLGGIGRIDVPVLHAWSRGDAAIGAWAPRRTGRYVAAPYEYVELDGLTHWLPETAPEHCATLIHRHIGRGER